MCNTSLCNKGPDNELPAGCILVIFLYQSKDVHVEHVFLHHCLLCFRSMNVS